MRETTGEEDCLLDIPMKKSVVDSQHGTRKNALVTIRHASPK
jgi:hypothetical protein